jgi:hypothetical protein
MKAAVNARVHALLGHTAIIATGCHASGTTKFELALID